MPLYQQGEIIPSEMNNSGTTKVCVPGFGLPIAFEPMKDMDNFPWRLCFRHGPNSFSPRRLTVREVAMLRFMDAITDKPDWNRKVNNEDIVAKWREESKSLPGTLFSEKAFDWCITELRDRAAYFERDGLVRTLEAGARCVKSDTVISPELRDELRAAVAPLLQVPDAKKDWHPESNKQVLNLVHPSLYPLVYGKSRILPTGQVGLLDCLQSAGLGETTYVDPDAGIGDSHEYRADMGYEGDVSFWSKRFQWLPADVKFVGDAGTDVKFTSYINNLHPVPHQSLYGVIEKFISKSIPAWNDVLMKQNPKNDVRIRVKSADSVEKRPEWQYEGDQEGNDPEVMEKLREYMALPDNPEYQQDVTEALPPTNWQTAPLAEWDVRSPYDRTEQWTVSEAVNWKFERIRHVIHPEPGEKSTYEQWKDGDPIEISSTWGSQTDHPESRDSYHVKIEKQFRSRGLQVIVKLSSIELSPEDPEYVGGNWHLEGMKNEHIAATAIYYYDVENCTPSRLRFRQEADIFDEDLEYEQDDHQPLAVVFGTKSMRDENAVQEIGSVDTREGRLLVFPNVLQHRVEPFELVDRTKPGHRRFLVLWLVDPHYRIASTANVPPQQRDWWYEHIGEGRWNRNLPQELTDEIMSHAKDGILTPEEAKEIRLQLMEERSAYSELVEHEVEQYNLCEH